MSGHQRTFNTYLAIVLSCLVFAGVSCKSAAERKRDHTYTTLWLHLEHPEGDTSTNRAIEAKVAGVNLRCTSNPFLTEENLSKASIVGTPEGGQALRLEFDQHGILTLDSITSQNRRRRILFYAEFGLKYRSKQKSVTQKRWLAAPQITRRVTDGVIVFTPDATPEELKEIVLGLSNAAKEASKPWVF